VVWLNDAQRYLDTADGTGERVAAGLRELLRERHNGKAARSCCPRDSQAARRC
jgi:hypothetical protein